MNSWDEDHGNPNPGEAEEDALSVLLHELAFHCTSGTNTASRNTETCKHERDAPCDETVPTTEFPSEETLCSDFNPMSSDQLIRDSLDDAITTLQTITIATCSLEDMAADLQYMTEEHEDQGLDLDTLSVFHSVGPPRHDDDDLLPTWLQIHTTINTHAYSCDNNQQRYESPSPCSQQLFDEVDYTLQNIESILDFVVDREQGQVQSLQDKSATIQHLNSQLEESRQTVQDLTHRIQGMETDLAETILRQTEATHKADLLHKSMLAKMDELSQYQQREHIVQEQNNHLQREIHDLTLEKTRFTNDIQRLQHTINTLQDNQASGYHERDMVIQHLTEQLHQLTCQITDERRRTEEAMDQCSTLEHTLQQYKVTIQKMELQEQVTRGILASLGDEITIKDDKIQSMQLTIHDMSMSHDNYKHNMENKEGQNAEMLRMYESDLLHSLEQMRMLRKTVDEKDACIHGLEKQLQTLTYPRDPVDDSNKNSNKNTTTTTKTSRLQNRESPFGIESTVFIQTETEERPWISETDHVSVPTIPGRSSTILPRRTQTMTASKTISPNPDSIWTSMENQLESYDSPQIPSHINTDTTTQNLHMENHDDLWVDAEQVIQSLDLKIASLEKVVQTLTEDQQEETALPMDSTTNPVPSLDGKNTVTHFYDIVDSSELDIDHLLSPEQVLLSVSDIDLVSLDGNVSNELRNDPIHRLEFAEDQLLMAGQTASSTLDVENLNKDALIKILFEQVLRLKTCLEEILESERLYDDECRRQLID